MLSFSRTVFPSHGYFKILLLLPQKYQSGYEELKDDQSKNCKMNCGDMNAFPGYGPLASPIRNLCSCSERWLSLLDNMSIFVGIEYQY